MKTYLEIPFEENGLAKAKGARYDMALKKWYCPDGVDLMKFAQWLPKEYRKVYDKLEGRKKTKTIWTKKP